MEDPKHYSFLSNGPLPVQGVDDGAEFQSTVNAMDIMGMTTDDYSGIYLFRSDVYLLLFRYICARILLFYSNKTSISI